MRTLIIILISGILLTACGYKGPLFIQKQTTNIKQQHAITSKAERTNEASQPIEVSP